MDNITQIPGLPGWVGMAIALIVAFIVEWRRNKSTKNEAVSESVKEASTIATKAKDEAIEAMQMHLNILRERMSEAERENMRMHHTVDVIYTALKARGIYITIDGDAVHIRDNGNSTTIRMKKEEHD